MHFKDLKAFRCYPRILIRFLQRLWRLVDAASVKVNTVDPIDRGVNLSDADGGVRRALHLAIEAISEDLGGLDDARDDDEPQP